jgi:hypothetical protein
MKSHEKAFSPTSAGFGRDDQGRIAHKTDKRRTIAGVLIALSCLSLAGCVVYPVGPAPVYGPSYYAAPAPYVYRPYYYYGYGPRYYGPHYYYGPYGCHGHCR